MLDSAVHYPAARRALVVALIGFLADEATAELQAAWMDMFDGIADLMLSIDVKAP